MKQSVKYLLVGLTTALLVFPANAQNKIGVVNLQKCFDNFWRTKQADSQIKERLAEFEKLGNTMFEDYKKSNEEFSKQVEGVRDPALSTEEKEKRNKELEKKRKDVMEMENNLKQFQQNSQKTLMEQKSRVRESILREVRGLIEEKSKAAGYTMVLDTAAMSVNQTPFVLYTTLIGSENDLSDAVSKQLASTAPPDAVKADAPKAPEKK
ncbi:MAG: OmpH family outer membrane protein [Pedosphaera sp.]|nr:OmpH family outer membrane protein [Pedosphaera sp.]